MSNKVEMNELLGRLNRIQTECGGNQPEQDETDKVKDPFDRLHFQVMRNFKDLSEALKELNEDENNVRLKQRVRKLLDTTKKQTRELGEIHRKKSKKKNRRNDSNQAERAEKLVAVENTYNKLNKIYRGRYQHNMPSNRNRGGGNTLRQDLTHRNTDTLSKPLLDSGGDNSVIADERDDADEVPDIDLSEFQTQLKETDAQIDEGLDYIHSGVVRLKNLATNVNDELQTQDVMLDEIERKIEKNDEGIQQLNTKLKKSLDQAGGCTRFVIVIIMVVIMIGIGGYIATIIPNLT
eukprot:gb/GECH01013376.1/.p1 GENE.gb/GECH01013376.1/~~gb/GECH01013376.1/.p1  ORF type:complete len:293 (+),score=102.55 gb/GECH01013376.1/:1-879(+)